MKRFLFAAILSALVSSVATAQDFPRVEVFGGYSMPAWPAKDHRRDFASGSCPDYWKLRCNDQFEISYPGLNVSAAANLTECLGIVTFSIQPGRFYKNRGDFSSDTKVKSMSMMAGPRFTLRKSKIVTLLPMLWRIGLPEAYRQF
jgi:hypothetical protein